MLERLTGPQPGEHLQALVEPLGQVGSIGTVAVARVLVGRFAQTDTQHRPPA
jgi:hypothetical protein